MPTTQPKPTKINPLHRDITDAEWDAMIGAAPQMREALEEAYRELHWLHKEYGGRAKTLEVMGQVREAIAEATHKPAPRPGWALAEALKEPVSGKRF